MGVFKPNWLKDNIRSLLALIWTCGALTIFVIVLLKPVLADEKLTYLIVGAVNSIVMFSLGYYYSASKLQTDNANNTSEITISEKQTNPKNEKIPNS